MSTNTDEIEALRASVRPILATLGAPHRHDDMCVGGCWYAVVERAAMAVVAEARAEALRDAWNRMNVATSGPNPDIGSFWEWLSDAAQDAEDAAEALVERLKGAIDGLAGAEVGK